MSELEFIVDQLKRAFDGEAWHGPAFMEILDGINAETAAAHRFLEENTLQKAGTLTGKVVIIP